MFGAGGSSERVTRDADLLGCGDNSPAGAKTTFREICAVKVEADGVEFEVNRVAAEAIRPTQDYGGVRVTLRARVGNARIPVQVDIGFGDAFTMEPEEIKFPALLEMPKPVLRAYTKETALAEKFEAIVSLGERNSRMKDYFDIRWLSQKFDFNRERLARAMAETFARRATEIPANVPVGLSPAFAAELQKQKQWQAFWRKAVRTEPAPDFKDVVENVRDFLLPPAQAGQAAAKWRRQWSKGGPWGGSEQPK